MTLAYPFVPVVRLTAEAICHPVLALRIILAGPVRNAVLLLVFNHLLDVETNMAKILVPSFNRPDDRLLVIVFGDIRQRRAKSSTVPSRVGSLRRAAWDFIAGVSARGTGRRGGCWALLFGTGFCGPVAGWLGREVGCFCGGSSKLGGGFLGPDNGDKSWDGPSRLGNTPK